ncbi:MAG TPA: hypothetical protein VMW87_09540 [Spirochaetia bacterium]|nr:hypothetical protein [Spirochaetia bacterium]
MRRSLLVMTLLMLGCGATLFGLNLSPGAIVHCAGVNEHFSTPNCRWRLP